MSLGRDPGPSIFPLPLLFCTPPTPLLPFPAASPSSPCSLPLLRPLPLSLPSPVHCPLVPSTCSLLGIPSPSVAVVSSRVLPDSSGKSSLLIGQFSLQLPPPPPPPFRLLLVPCRGPDAAGGGGHSGPIGYVDSDEGGEKKALMADVFAALPGRAAELRCTQCSSAAGVFRGRRPLPVPGRGDVRTTRRGVRTPRLALG